MSDAKVEKRIEGDPYKEKPPAALESGARRRELSFPREQKQGDCNARYDEIERECLDKSESFLMRTLQGKPIPKQDADERIGEGKAEAGNDPQ